MSVIMDTRTILLSLMTLIVIGIAIMVIYGLFTAYDMSAQPYNPTSPQKNSVVLIGPLHSGMDSVTLDAALPRSMNENNGLEYSFVGWILINDFSYGTSTEPIIFIHGTGSPAVSLNTSRNFITIKQRTYNGEENIKIRNMPSEKLFHLAVTVTQTAIDIYVNGLLHTHKSLESLPLVEDASVQVGPNGGWKGKIGTLVYYNYALSAGEVRTIASTKAVRNPADEPPNPPYFDTTWWIGRT